MRANANRLGATSRLCQPARIAVVSTALGLLLPVVLLVAPASGQGCELSPGPSHTVARIIDGETFVLDSGAEVRLIGAMSPAAGDLATDPGDWPLAAAARAALEQLLAGRTVDLAFAGRRTDRHGRLTAHAFIRTNGASVWAQGEMLRQGLARAYSLDGNSACMSELIAHEEAARQSSLGLWAQAVYQVRSAEQTVELLGAAGTFQIVEGKVRSVAEIAGTTYLNFGEDWRQDFTIGIKSSVKRLAAASGLAPSDLEGRRIRVRGWIERRGGPFIDLHHPHQIEVLAEAGPETSQPAAPSRRSRPRTKE